jgi:hypothetical protein
MLVIHLVLVGISKGEDWSVAASDLSRRMMSLFASCFVINTMLALQCCSRCLTASRSPTSCYEHFHPSGSSWFSCRPSGKHIVKLVVLKWIAAMTAAATAW